MKPAPFDYVRPASIEEACNALAEAGGGATIIAGGQTLMPLLNLRMSQPFVLVDLAAIAELKTIRHADGALRIGAMVTQAQALADPLVARHLPAMASALGHVGHHQTRNRGTVGGSIAFGEPAAELPATMVALDARLHLASTQGKRSVPAREYYFGPFATAIRPDEILASIEIPDWAEGHVPIFGEVCRRPGDFALTGLVGALEDDGARVTRAGLAWFGMGATPVRAAALEEHLVGAEIASLEPSELAQLALGEAEPFDDKAASAEYRKLAGRKLAERLLRDALRQEVPA